ncbi:MAG: primosomal protein, partial [Bacteroidota bacterium]
LSVALREGGGGGREAGEDGVVGGGAGLEAREADVLAAAGCSRAILRTLMDRGFLRTEEREKERSGGGAGSRGRKAGGGGWTPAPLPQLSPAQVVALQAIRAAERRPALLHGVTGSGKTEVFIHLIADALERGGQVLLLVPEIALTTQLIGRLGAYFEPYLAIYHSRFNLRERTETYLDVLRSPGQRRGRLVVGPRSAVLLPFQHLDLVIVDEEHEPSFKQQDPAPRYQARDVAVMLASRFRAQAVLASATPSLESEWNVAQAKFLRIPLTERYGGAQLPTIEVVDLRQAMRERSIQGHLTLPLHRAIEETLAQGRQVMLFQNRRGYAPMWICGTCGWVPECPRCDVALTHHKSRAQLNCHHCGYQLFPPPPRCLRCGGSDMRSQGLGTQRLEEEVAERYPGTRVARMDLDSTRSREAHGRLVADFAAQAYDILVGTQMITKGLDFAHVGLVGVLGADRLLNFPDFRSFERAFAMLTQVAGRAGRRGDPGAQGRVIIQTFAPTHWVLEKVLAADHAGFVRREMADRAAHHMPPVTRMIRLVLRYLDAALVEEAAHALAHRLRQRFGERVLGPEPPALAKMNDLHHQVILLLFERTLNPAQYKDFILQDVDALGQDARWKRVRVVVDVDPF